jgi:hypothetical protein
LRVFLGQFMYICIVIYYTFLHSDLITFFSFVQSTFHSNATFQWTFNS